MKRKNVVIALIIFLITLILIINYYLTHDYEINLIEKNNITAKASNENSLDEVLLPVGYLEYDLDKKYWGYINTQGEVVISLVYDEALEFDENFLAIVRLGKKYGLINTRNEKILPVEYNEIKYLGRDLYYFAKKGLSVLGKFNPLSNKIDTVKELDYDEIGLFTGSLAYVVSGKKLGYIKENGELFIPLNFDYKKDFNYNFYDGYAFVHQNNKIGIINEDGEVVLEPQLDEVMVDYLLDLDYKDVYYLNNEFIPFKKDNLWGYMNKSGSVLISPKYLEAYPFTDYNLLARVKIADNHYNFINQQGEVLSEIKYEEAFDFYHGYAMTRLYDREGLINAAGKIVIGNEYDYVGTVNQNHILTYVDGRSKYYDIRNLNNIIYINYHLGDDMTDCNVFFATDDGGVNRNYVILNLQGQRIYEEITAKSYQQINYFNEDYISLAAYEKESNLEYYTYLDSDGVLLWKVYK